jgi:hypothetical protein
MTVRASPIERAGAIGADVLTLATVVFSLPFVILAVALPVVLVLRLLLWVGGLF